MNISRKKYQRVLSVVFFAIVLGGMLQSVLAEHDWMSLMFAIWSCRYGYHAWMQIMYDEMRLQSGRLSFDRYRWGRKTVSVAEIAYMVEKRRAIAGVNTILAVPTFVIHLKNGRCVEYLPPLKGIWRNQIDVELVSQAHDLLSTIQPIRESRDILNSKLLRHYGVNLN